MSRLIVLSLVVLAGVAAGRVPSSATQLRDVEGVRRDLFSPSGAGEVEYRGRIDNRYEQLGRERRVVTVRDLRDALDAVLTGRPVARPATEPVGCFIPFASSRSTVR